MTSPNEHVEALIRSWLPAQRWFAGKGRDGTLSAAPVAVLQEDGPSVALWIAQVDYTDGAHETYQLPLVERAEPVMALDHVLLGTVERGDAPVWIYDALHDKDVTQLFLAGLLEQTTEGPLQFQRFVDPELIPVEQPSLVLTGEQSNTSLVFGGKAIMKVFRRLEPGINPDIEVHEALGRVGSGYIAQLYGSVTAAAGTVDPEPVSLAMLQDFMTTATDGWDLAKTSVRDLMAEADLHAEEAGGDFAGEAERLGAAVASVHASLAEAFGLQVLGGDQLRERAAGMNARLDAALKIVPELAEVESGLRGAFAALAENDTPLEVQRVHGDLHLGQVLRTVRRWVILDFEGEPLKSLAERRLFDSPLRDVAGMLRSFDYAARHQLIDSAMNTQLEYRASEWAARNRRAFADGYATASGEVGSPVGDPLRQASLLRAFEADKAVYEAVYEARNRPAWLPIPLASLARLATEPLPVPPPVELPRTAPADTKGPS